MASLEFSGVAGPRKGDVDDLEVDAGVGDGSDNSDDKDDGDGGGGDDGDGGGGGDYGGGNVRRPTY